jgi:hypothetical protein
VLVQPMTTSDEHDRAAGRQLAWVLVVVSALAIAGVVWLGSVEPEPLPAWAIGTPPVLVALAIAAFVKPVIVIRAVTGRFDELLGMWADSGAPGKALATEVRPVVTSLQEGTPLEIVAAEDVVKSVVGRRRLGKLLMLGGLVATGVAVAFLGRIPESLVALPPVVFVGGLAIWYRTL